MLPRPTAVYTLSRVYSRCIFARTSSAPRNPSGTITWPRGRPSPGKSRRGGAQRSPPLQGRTGRTTAARTGAAATRQAAQRAPQRSVPRLATNKGVKVCLPLVQVFFFYGIRLSDFSRIGPVVGHDGLFLTAIDFVHKGRRPTRFREHMAMCFGAAASVWHLNRTADALQAIQRVLLWIIASHFVDDFNSVDMDEVADSAFHGMAESCRRNRPKLNRLSGRAGGSHHRPGRGCGAAANAEAPGPASGQHRDAP